MFSKSRNLLLVGILFFSLPAFSKDLDKKDRMLLINGYSQLDAALNSLAWTDKIFLVKFESDKVQKFGEALTKASKGLKKELEALAKKTKWLVLDNTGFPEIENLKQAAVRKDRLVSFLPVVGRSQANFERTLLLSNSGALNQMQHLAEVLMDIETDKARTGYLKKAKKAFSNLYEEDIRLLNTHYFCHNTDKESKEFR